ncbi:MAG: aspartate aminotransferase family protein [Thermoleophilaceae bacterium]|nr:aspartate aminotransferase family protein [Thermoleophilaceae bacterium]
MAAAEGGADGRRAVGAGGGVAAAATGTRERLARLTARERERFERSHPRSRELHVRARGSLLSGVPMSWMTMWAGAHPVYASEARGARVVDVDGNEYADLCLGDTGAMAGHSPEPTMAAIRDLAGLTTMLPTEDAVRVGDELARRFGLPYWQFALTATDANRWILRMAREVTGRPRVLVFNWCYHGTVDEALVTLDDGVPRSREGNVGPMVDPTLTTRVAEFNELPSVEATLAEGDVACLLMEPALTNIGIVLPEDGFLAGVREACTRAETLLVIDETHTLSAGPGGCTAAWGLEPDAVTLGKAIGGGVPIGAYGVSAELGERIAAAEDADLEDTGGVGGTLAGNALSLAAARATLEQVLTEAAFARMSALRERFVAGVERSLAAHSAPWWVVSLGARAEYRFRPEPPRTGAESATAADRALEEYVHLYLLNRGVLITPFHNMALMCPATTEDDVDRHSAAFDAALADLFG